MRLDDVWQRYTRGGPWVLKGVSAGISPGETVVVLGRNGAGKSTLLQLIAGILVPSRGRVHERPAVVGWVPERFPADQPFTAEAYLRAMARVRGARQQAVDEWIERLGLGLFRAVRLAELSKGTGQKVGLAQALLQPPHLLVLDEPWEGLDAATRELVPAIVGEVTGGGGSVLVSDHRGETAWLPDASQWTVDQGELRVGRPETQRSVIEVAVPSAEVTDTLAKLRADGLEILRVRQG